MGRLVRHLVWLLLPGVVLAQGEPVERRAFAALSGRDTLFTERWVRAGDRSEAELRSADGTRLRYRLDLDPEGGVERLSVSVWAKADPADRPAPLQREFVVTRDRAVVHDGATGLLLDRLIVGRGAVPFLPAGLSLLQRQIRRADQQGDVWYNGTFWTPVLLADGDRVTVDTLRFTTRGVDSLEASVGDLRLVVAVDDSGRMVGGAGTAGGASIRIVPLDPRRANAPWSPEPVDYAAPPGAPYRALPFTLTAGDGVTLGGTLTLPDGVDRAPAVLLLSGSGAQDRDARLFAGYRPMRELADALARAGIASLRLDDRGVGASGGDYAQRTIPELADDARRALDKLRARREIDRDRLMVLGHSEGALVALEALHADPRLRGGVLLGAPSRTGREIVAWQQAYGAARMVRDSAPERRQPLADSLVRAASPLLDELARTGRGFRFFLDYDPRPVARAVTAPLLLVHGAEDRQVPVEQAEELAALLRGTGRDVTLRRFAETDHLLLADRDGDPAGYVMLDDRRLRPEVVSTIVAWLRARLVAS